VRPLTCCGWLNTGVTTSGGVTAQGGSRVIRIGPLMYPHPRSGKIIVLESSP
jgi:hypothetical protein